MNTDHYKEYIIRPTLDLLNPEIPYTEAAVNLVLLTAIAESNLSYVKQLGGGPARGLCQMEPDTEQSLWRHYLSRKPSLKEKIEGMCIKGVSRELNITCNLIYQVAMCRLKYYPDSQALPKITDTDGMANYYLRIYNTEKGKAKYENAHSIYKFRVLQKG